MNSTPYLPLIESIFDQFVLLTNLDTWPFQYDIRTYSIPYILCLPDPAYLTSTSMTRDHFRLRHQ